MIYKKSQTSIEFIILVAALLFFFTIFFIAIQINISDKMKETKDIVVKEIAKTVQDEINLASQSDDGYYREFEIPNEIQGDDYNITIIEDLVYLKTADEKHAIALPVKKINGQIAKDKNIIKKINGEVQLNL